MTVFDETLFDRWEADLPPEERPIFCRDGAVDDEMWKSAPLRALFVTAEPNVESKTAGAKLATASRDLRVLSRQRGGGGAFGTPLARWTAMLLDGVTPAEAAALDRTARRSQIRRIAQINLKKTGGGAKARTTRVSEWSARHRERLREQIDCLAPDVIILCGGHVLTAWPALGIDASTDRLLIKTVHPSAPGLTYERKDAAVAAFAASPEVAALRRS